MTYIIISYLVKVPMNYLLQRFVIARFSTGSQKTITSAIDPTLKSFTVTLANPAKRNTLSFDTLSQLQKALEQAKSHIKDSKIKSLFIRSQGTVFSSGHDLKQLGSNDKAQAIFTLCSDTLSSFASLPIPVVAVVNGLAAAAGCQLVASCDLAIATQKSSFSTPGVKWGLFCTTPGVAVVRSMTSQKKALEMLLLGEPITAQEAYNFGLINKVVKEEELEQETKKYAEAISKLSSEVIALGKKAYWEQRSKNTLSEAYKSAVAAMCLNLKTEDTKEGLKAFSEKRHPHFKN